jgi:hypothetical protein
MLVFRMGDESDSERGEHPCCFAVELVKMGARKIDSIENQQLAQTSNN